jgi:hypothetical protein
MPTCHWPVWARDLCRRGLFGRQDRTVPHRCSRSCRFGHAPQVGQVGIVVCIYKNAEEDKDLCMRAEIDLSLERVYYRGSTDAGSGTKAEEFEVGAYDTCSSRVNSFTVES